MRAEGSGTPRPRGSSGQGTRALRTTEKPQTRALWKPFPPAALISPGGGRKRGQLPAPGAEPVPCAPARGDTPRCRERPGAGRGRRAVNGHPQTSLPVTARRGRGAGPAANQRRRDAPSAPGRPALPLRRAARCGDQLRLSRSASAKR